MVEQIFLPPQVKRSVIISIRIDIYELSHEFLNDLRLRILGNYETAEKSQNVMELLPSAQSSPRNESFVDTSKNLLKAETELFL